MFRSDVGEPSQVGRFKGGVHERFGIPLNYCWYAGYSNGVIISTLSMSVHQHHDVMPRVARSTRHSTSRTPLRSGGHPSKWVRPPQLRTSRHMSQEVGPQKQRTQPATHSTGCPSQSTTHHPPPTTRSSHRGVMPKPPPTTPDGTHATGENGDTIHTPRTQGARAVHDVLATRRTEHGNGRRKVVMCWCRGTDPASGHLRAHRPPLGRGSRPLVLGAHLDAPGQRRAQLPSSVWTQHSETGKVRGPRWHN